MDVGQEIVDRVRRIETRVTKIGNHMGVDVGGGKPVWDMGRCSVVLPSLNCSIREIVDIIPPKFAGHPVNVFVGDDHFTTIVPICG
jgi:hypothetical protein